MRARMMTIAVLAGCGFNPGGEGAGGDPDADEIADDAPDPDGLPPPIDAPPIEIDAPLPIDAPAIDAAPSCPVGYDIALASGTYALRTAPMFHAFAKADCEDDLPGRTHLATFEDAQMFAGDIETIDPADTSAVFLGGSCSAADCEERVNWFWDTGSVIASGLWAEGQPNLGFSQRVLVAQIFEGNWALNNTEASNTLPYLCECNP